MRLISTIAIGDRMWGDMALNLAISIKTDNPDQKIALIYEDSAIEGIEDLIFRYVDFGHRIIKDYGNYEQVNLEKVHLYDTITKICPEATEVVYLDADVMLLPGNEVSPFFDKNSQYDYFFYKNGEYDYDKKKKSRKDGSFWCNPEKIKKELAEHGTEIKHNMPQVVSAFLYFKANESAKLFFTVAQIVYSEELSYTPRKDSKCADFCFNVSASILGSPTQKYYRPLFIQQYSENRSDIYIWHRYRAIALDSAIYHDNRIIAMYNSVCRYLRDLSGITLPFVFKRRRTELNKEKPVVGFWHVLASNHYKQIVLEQLDQMIASGLYWKADKIYVFCIGQDVKWLQSILVDYDKFVLFGSSEDVKLYEFPTLIKLQEYAEKNDAFCFYIHTKGVTYPEQPRKEQGDYYRMFLMSYVVLQWQKNIDLLMKGHTCSGPGWIPEGAFPQHYRGNFWWANSDYINTLPRINTLDTTNRFNAEFWIGMGQADPGITTHSIVDYPNAQLLYEKEIIQSWH
jgi:hypothetical protein